MIPIGQLFTIVSQPLFDKLKQGLSNVVPVMGTAISALQGDIPSLQRVYGLIAEEVEEAGLGQFVMYGDPNENGKREAEGLIYERI
ncbi:hypothetical protein [Niallia nealsonii]|uniref:hypothetical protein n=1 Tax=Niallia nealsonii TaxID=115979 RepID=UPI0012FE93FB|nr:hypothetical protein [Niallia nealsonii]